MLHGSVSNEKVMIDASENEVSWICLQCLDPSMSEKLEGETYEDSTDLASDLIWILRE